MTHEEQNQYIESTLEEIQTLLTSMKGLMILTEHYSNPKETTEYIAMLYKCAAKLETLVKEARTKME
ncbi:MAG: hypothetical protein C0490_15200 [Marivirga sp.]|nr:hypothetical protein [Marivirga sp.]